MYVYVSVCVDATWNIIELINKISLKMTKCEMRETRRPSEMCAQSKDGEEKTSKEQLM